MLKSPIIQGGMGAGVSDWYLANTVSRIGQLGVVSGTALDVLLARRLQDGDPNGDIRRALEYFPFQDMARRILNKYFISGGRKNWPYKKVPMHTLEGNREAQELCIAGNFAEVFLAKEDHSNPVGINYLEKIQLPHLASIYGAMLAGVDAVIMGAGIPLEIPGALESLSKNQPSDYLIHVINASKDKVYKTYFDPNQFNENQNPNLTRPDFYPIISSSALANILIKRANGPLSGFVIEGPLAGGHNAPPRGKPAQFTSDGQPIYGPRDAVDLAEMRKIGLPFYLAGNYGSPERFQEALREGAAGIQVGTAFALCAESGLESEIKRRLIQKALNKAAQIFTDPIASSTGFPFKVAKLEGTLSEKEVYQARKRICDLGFLRELYEDANGKVGYRCSAEPERSFIAKGGRPEEAVGRKCLCNALTANIGIEQILPDGTLEKALVTLGDDFAGIGRFCSREHPEYTVEDVIRKILGK